MRSTIFARIIIVLTVMLPAGGCLGTAADNEAVPSGTQQVIVQYDEGQSVEFDVVNGSGAILGQVRNDAGDGLPEIHVSILGADHVAMTNRSGWFQFTNLTPASYTLRADRQGYAAAESAVVVKADQVARVIITLMFLGKDSAGAEHVHDYWGERTEVVVMDQDYVYHARHNGNNAVYNTALRYADTAIATQAQSTSCVAGAPGNEDLYGRPIYFAEPNQLVWAGTARIDVTFTWSDADYAADETMAIAYKAANDTGHGYWSLPIARGAVYSIAVEPSMWDSGHQRFTFWEFNACLWGKDEAGGKTMTGAFHVKMTMVRRLPLLVEPPHPEFWKNGTRIRVVDAWRNNSCEPTAYEQTGCHNRNLVTVFQDRAGSYGAAFHTVRPAGATLVPPGTGRVTMRLEWFAPTAPALAPLSVTYSPADVPRTQKWDVEQYKVPAATQTGATFRAYEFDIKPGENDAFYQTSSNWVFLWGNEGEERDPGWTPTCVCHVHLTVDVEKDPDYDKAAEDASSGPT